MIFSSREEILVYQARRAIRVKQSSIKLLDREQTNNQKKMKMLETHEYDPDCQYCSENKFVKDAHTAKEKFAENAGKAGYAA